MLGAFIPANFFELKRSTVFLICIFKKEINNGCSNTDRKTLNSLDCTLLSLISGKDLSHVPSHFTWRSCAILREALIFSPSLLETAASRQRVKFRLLYQHLLRAGQHLYR